MPESENLHYNITDDEERKTRRCKITAKIICVLMILTMGLCIIYSMTIQGVKREQDMAVEQLKEEQFAQIENYLKILGEDARGEVKEVSNNIEKDINTKVDLDKLKSDMDNNVMSKELHEILIENIEGKCLHGINNYRNGIIVATEDCILEDGSYDRSSTEPRSWDHDIKNSYNPDLKDAYYKIINHHTDDLIVIEPVNLMDDDSNHTKVSKMDMNILKDIFMNEGIEGLRNYQFFAPSYITENGDVFGQEDIIQGQRNDTHKIIVIQEFNLYDQIQKEYPEMINFNDDIKYLQSRHTDTMNWLYVLGCLYIISTVIMLIYTSSVYNQFIEVNGLLSHDEEE